MSSSLPSRYSIFSVSHKQTHDARDGGSRLGDVDGSEGRRDESEEGKGGEHAGCSEGQRGEEGEADGELVELWEWNKSGVCLKERGG